MTEAPSIITPFLPPLPDKVPRDFSFLTPSRRRDLALELACPESEVERLLTLQAESEEWLEARRAYRGRDNM